MPYCEFEPGWLSVSKVDMLWVWRFNIRIRVAPLNYFCKTPTPSGGLFTPSVRWVLAVPCRRVKLPFHEIDYLRPSRGGIESYCSSVHYLHVCTSAWQIPLAQSITKYPLTFAVGRWCHFCVCSSAPAVL